MRAFLGIIGLCAAGALSLASAGIAGKPVTQTLNPPPPPFETCMTVGSGTICQGTIDSSYGPFDTGLVCGSGPGAFGIADSATQQELARRVYDADGNLVQRVLHDRYQGHLSNETSGATLPYIQTQVATDVLGVPGDFASATTTLTGEFIARPAAGAPVVIGAGRTVFAGGRIEFQAGPSGFLDLVAGSSTVVAPICTALGE